MKKIIKRDGRKVNFDEKKILQAIEKAFESQGKKDEEKVEKITDEVVQKMEEIYKRRTPTVEQVQDLIETVLMENDELDVAKAYILYRAERTRIREANTCKPFVILLSKTPKIMT